MAASHHGWLGFLKNFQVTSHGLLVTAVAVCPWLKSRSHTRIGIFFWSNWNMFVALHHHHTTSISIGNALDIGDYLPSPASACSSHSHGEISGVLAVTGSDN